MIETPNGRDILAALRDVAAEMFRGDDLPNIYTDAANEIQTLRSKLDSAHAAIEALQRSEQSSVAEIANLQSRLQACEKYAANLDKLTREQDQAQDAMHKTTIAMRERADQLEKHRERAYEDVANISVENHELRSRLDSVRCLLAKWEPMANSASDHEAGAALTCIDDLKAVLVEKHESFCMAPVAN